MGNFMACHSQPKNQNRYPQIEGKEVEADTPVAVERMKSASKKRYIVVRRKLQHGEVYQLAPFMLQSDMPLVPCWTTNNRKLKTRSVKIVVTAEELELLLRGSKKFQVQRRVARVKRSSGLRGCQKWFPSLPTIQEVHNY
ncbi:hypothetical protein LR48_Vigan09g200200 [Vigna angularis]|uniref:Uncharacterized protein n=2 Tax=Phaseolus angularis TaxID=3914 RepID=A0A0L9VEB2_PHAAN|nr:uncharacterized protein HKW66_Vig0070050 [Vigna angularis]KOM53343.1 hypothetical protein LR48_Vigan09g200200 [Vigna angularis]BAT87557.1 hypothetical protein VIGAN_05094000 [Vigna angularis var. angularis]